MGIINFKRIMSFILLVATMATLLVGCGSSKELPPPAKPASEVLAEGETAAEPEVSTAAQPAKNAPILEYAQMFPELTINELCELPLVEMQQLKTRGILSVLSEEDEIKYTESMKEKQAEQHRFWITSGRYPVHRELNKNMVWTPDDENYCKVAVDCITGIIYELPDNLTAEEIAAYVYTQRDALYFETFAVHADAMNGTEVMPEELCEGLWYDKLTDSEYTSPLDIYLARKEYGLLYDHILVGEVGEKVKAMNTFNARPEEEIIAAQRILPNLSPVIEETTSSEPNYLEMTIDELCSLSALEMQKADQAGVREYLTKGEEVRFLNTESKKMADFMTKTTSSIGGMDDIYYALYPKLIWTPDGDDLGKYVVDCITGIVYQIPEEVHDIRGVAYSLGIIEDREKIGLTAESGRGSCRMKQFNGPCEDLWTGEEYENPLDMYLSRKEAGILQDILGDEIYNKIDQTKTY